MQKSILFVGNFLSQSYGSPSPSVDLARRLRALGWTIFLTSDKPNKVHRLFDMISTAVRRRRQYSLAHVDVFSGPAFMWADAVGRILKTLKKPFVLTLKGGDLPGFGQRWPGRVKRLLNSAAVVTTPSHYLLYNMSCYSKNVQLIPNSLDSQKYPYKVRSSLQPRLIWLRAFHEIYNPSLAPLVLSRLIQDFPDISLKMIGPDKGDGSLNRTQNKVKELGLNGRVIFSGMVPKKDVPLWLNKGDIFLNTTNVDNTPVSVIEAMACGLCVVSTNVGGIPYLLEHGRDALLVPPEDPEAMARAVRRILTEPGLSAHLSRNARKKVEGFDWSITLPQWEALLTRVAAGTDHE